MFLQKNRCTDLLEIKETIKREMFWGHYQLVNSFSLDKSQRKTCKSLRPTHRFIAVFCQQAVFRHAIA